MDIDGLLDGRPEFFAFLSGALRAAGHFVAVLTYRDPAREEADQWTTATVSDRHSHWGRYSAGVRLVTRAACAT